MKNPVLLFFGTVLTLTVQAQAFNAGTKWPGSVETTEGRFEGFVDVNTEVDQALLTSNGNIRLFSARQIKKIRTQVSGSEAERVYYGLEFEGEYHLFQVITKGKLKVLYRQGIRMRYETTVLPPYYLLKEGTPTPLESEKAILNAFGEDEKWMKQYIKNQGLRLTQREGIQSAFNYYNDQYEAINP